MKEQKYLFLGMVILYALLSPVNSIHAASTVKALTNNGLVGWWMMDEGVGTIAHDFSGNGNDGTLTNSPTWVRGKRGGALSFNGSNTYVAGPSISVSNTITASAWVYSSNFNQNGFVIGRNPVNTQWELFFEATVLRWRGGAGENTVFCDIPTNNKWHHIVGTQTGTTGTLYIDGVQCGTGTVTAIGNAAGTVDIGRFASAYHFNGLIDDVRLYNRVLTASEVAALYRSGEVVRKNVSNNGLVGHWSLDEGISTIAHDFSGLGNNGTLTGMDPNTDWITGKRNKALDFDGSNDQIVVSDNSSLDLSNTFSISMWIYLRSAASTGFMIKGDGTVSGAALAYGWSSNGFQFIGWNSCNSPAAPVLASDLNQWHHLVGTVAADGTRTLYIDGVLTDTPTSCGTSSWNNVNNLVIGTPAGYYGNAKIDDVRVYNRVLSNSEVNTLFKQNNTIVNTTQNNKLTNGLVGLWSFNGVDMNWTSSSAGTAYDRSGNNRNGVLNNMVQGTTPVSGRVGQALLFNGGNEYVEIPQPLTTSSPFTISMWFYPTAINGSYEILYSGNDNIDLQLFFHAGTKALNTSIENVEIDGGFTLTSATINKWQHIVWTYDYVRRKVYVNGVLTADNADTTALTINDASVRFGKLLNGLGYTLNGRMDEARIYNRAITAAEAKQLYLMGK